MDGILKDIKDGWMDGWMKPFQDFFKFQVGI
jgi:hypothetical protein